jgi:hypothetical protein
VNKSRKFCGIAQMMSPALQVNQTNLWKQSGKWPGSIDIKWILIKDVLNTQFTHLTNPFNEDKPACQGRDCQEVDPFVGDQMISIFMKSPSHSNLLE